MLILRNRRIHFETVNVLSNLSWVSEVEAQTSTHYGMPVKNPAYDVTGYISQVRMFTKDNKHNKAYTTSAEFLSGIPECWI